MALERTRRELHELQQKESTVKVELASAIHESTFHHDRDAIERMPKVAQQLAEVLHRKLELIGNGGR